MPKDTSKSEAGQDFQKKLLVVEDDGAIRDIISEVLGYEFEVKAVSSIREARAQVQKISYDVIVLDINLPDESGLDFCLMLSRDRKFASIPIVIISGLGTPQDRLAGLEMGAIEYVAKPFDPYDLKARIQVSYARSKSLKKPEFSELIQFGSLFIDMGLQRVTVKERQRERDLHLTPIEFKLLSTLVRARGEILARTELKKSAWGPGVNATVPWIK
jgi:DNA-binding response OmpR family regulator